MAKKFAVSNVLVIILISCFCFLLVGQFILYGCLWWECAPERNFRVSDLEIPSNLFPNKAILNHVHPLSDQFGTTADGSQSVFWDNGKGTAVYIIYRYPSTKGAMDQFDFTKHSLIDPKRGSMEPPADLTFSSPTADIVYIACGYARLYSKECTLVARYQEYVIFFRADIDEKMTYPKFEETVIYIDKQISNRLYP